MFVQLLLLHLLLLLSDYFLTDFSIETQPEFSLENSSSFLLLFFYKISIGTLQNSLWRLPPPLL